MKATIHPFSQPVAILGKLELPVLDLANSYIVHAESRMPRLSRDQQAEQDAADRQERGTNAFNDIKFAIAGKLSDPFAKTPSCRTDPINGRCKEIVVAVIDAYGEVHDDAPVVEALRKLLANPCPATSDAFEMAVAEQYAGMYWESLAEAREPQ